MDNENGQTIEQRILDAAKLVFVRKGFEATTMGEVAAEAGMGRTALHYYYRTKDMLYDAIFGQLIDQLLPNIASVVDSQMPVIDKLDMIVKSYVATLLQNQLFPVFAVNELNRDPQRLYKALLHDESKLEALIRLRAMLTEEMQAGHLNSMPLHYVATTVVSLLVFPMLVRQTMTDLFLDGDSSRYDVFLRERVPFVLGIVHNLLIPADDKKKP